MWKMLQLGFVDQLVFSNAAVCAILVDFELGEIFAYFVVFSVALRLVVPVVFELIAASSAKLIVTVVVVVAAPVVVNSVLA